MLQRMTKQEQTRLRNEAWRRQIREQEPRPPRGYEPWLDEKRLQWRYQTKAPTCLPNNGRGQHSDRQKIANAEQRHVAANHVARKLGNVRPGCKLHTVKLSRCEAFLHQLRVYLPKRDTRIQLVEQAFSKSVPKNGRFNADKITFSIGIFTKEELRKIHGITVPKRLRRK